MSDSDDMPHYMRRLYDMLRPEFPQARIMAPLPVAGRPGAIGVMAINPLANDNDDSQEYDQHVSVAVDDLSELSNDAALKALADDLAVCMRRPTILSTHKPRHCDRAIV